MPRQFLLPIRPALVILLFALMPVLFGRLEADDSKTRIENEFVQLEKNLFQSIKSCIRTAPDLDSMNNAMYQYLSENPGIYRILRTNSGGFIVNDVNSETVTPQPTRNISDQKWLQTVKKTKKPYHSANLDSSGNLSLFWAHPLLTGSEQNSFSGAVAAFIDLTTILALTEDNGSFQVAHGGKAFFQHNWDDLDFIEEPLDIKGARNVFIRIPKPFTQQAPLSIKEAAKNTDTADIESSSVAQTDSSASKDSAALGLSKDTIDEKNTSENNPAVSQRTKENLLRFTGLLLIFLLSPALALMIIRRQNKNRSGRFILEESPLYRSSGSGSREEKVIIPSLSQKAATLEKTKPQYQSGSTTAESQSNQVEKQEQQGSSGLNDVKEAMRQMQDEVIELLAEEVSRLDKEVEKLNRRIEELEGKQK